MTLFRLQRNFTVYRKYTFSGGSGQERLPETSHPDADYLIILRHQAEVEDLHPPSMRQATVSTSASSAPPALVDLSTGLKQLRDANPDTPGGPFWTALDRHSGFIEVPDDGFRRRVPRHFASTAALE
ncbi:MAG: hypothetical protein ACYDDU_09965 [Dermatophilaceae bacterium]